MRPGHARSSPPHFGDVRCAVPRADPLHLSSSGSPARSALDASSSRSRLSACWPNLREGRAPHQLPLHRSSGMGRTASPIAVARDRCSLLFGDGAPAGPSHCSGASAGYRFAMSGPAKVAGIVDHHAQVDLEAWIADDVQRETSANEQDCRPKRTSLTRAEWQSLNSTIAKRVETFASAYKPVRNERDADTSGRIFPPDVRNCGFYPSIGISKAAKWAGRAAVVGGGKNLRLMTLRSKIPPDQGKLETHLRQASKLLGEHATYLQKRGLAQVWLNVVNIRVDDATGKFDPHIHGFWEMQAEHVPAVRDYLEQRYRVWIDEDCIRDVKKSVFYACSGIFDYGKMPSWPLALFKEAHAISGLKLIRASGPLKAARAHESSLFCHHCAERESTGRATHGLPSSGASVQMRPLNQRPVEPGNPHRCHCCGTSLTADGASGVAVDNNNSGSRQGGQTRETAAERVGDAVAALPAGSKATASEIDISNGTDGAKTRPKGDAGIVAGKAKSRVRRRGAIRDAVVPRCNSDRVTVRPPSRDSSPHEPLLSTLAQVAGLMQDRLAHGSERAEATFDRFRIDEFQALRSLRDVEIFFGTMLVDLDEGWTLTADGMRFLEISADAIKAATASMQMFERSLPSNPRAALWMSHSE